MKKLFIFSSLLLLFSGSLWAQSTNQKWSNWQESEIKGVDFRVAYDHLNTYSVKIGAPPHMWDAQLRNRLDVPVSVRFSLQDIGQAEVINADIRTPTLNPGEEKLLYSFFNSTPETGFVNVLIYDKNTLHKSVIVIAQIVRDEAGNKTIKNLSYQLTTLSEVQYLQLKDKLPGTTFTTEIYITRMFVQGGKASIVKNISISDKNIVTESVSIVYAPQGGDYNVAFAPEGTNVDANERFKSFVVCEVDLDEKVPTFIELTKAKIKYIILDSKGKFKTKTTSDGVRG